MKYLKLKIFWLIFVFFLVGAIFYVNVINYKLLRNIVDPENLIHIERKKLLMYSVDNGYVSKVETASEEIYFDKSGRLKKYVDLDGDSSFECTPVFLGVGLSCNSIKGWYFEYRLNKNGDVSYLVSKHGEVHLVSRFIYSFEKTSFGVLVSESDPLTSAVDCREAKFYSNKELIKEIRGCGLATLQDVEYEYLEFDHMGNWISRKERDGQESIFKRKLTYF